MKETYTRKEYLEYGKKRHDDGIISGRDHNTTPSKPTQEFIIKATEHLKSIDKHFKDCDGEKGIIPRIEDHVMKTNGRVKKLELKAAFATGAIVIISMVGGFFINELINYREKVEEHSKQILLLNNQPIDYSKIEKYIDDNYIKE